MTENIFASPTKYRPTVQDRTLRNILTFSLVVLVLTVISVPAVVSVRDVNDLISPDKRDCCVPPDGFPYALTLVTIPTEDGLTLRGWMIPSQNRAAVMILHGRGGDRRDGMPLARVLASQGYGVLLFDLRAHGSSDGDIFAYGWRDVTAAADFLNGRPDVEPGKVAALGLSLGGNMALIGAAQTTNIAAVISEGAGAVTMDDHPMRDQLRDWLLLPGTLIGQGYLQARTGEWSLLSMRDAAAQFAPRPLMLIASNTADVFGEPFEMQVNQQIASVAPDTTTLWITEGASHAGGYRLNPAGYRERILTFLDTALQPANLIPSIN